MEKFLKRTVLVAESHIARSRGISPASGLESTRRESDFPLKVNGFQEFSSLFGEIEYLVYLP